VVNITYESRSAAPASDSDGGGDGGGGGVSGGDGGVQTPTGKGGGAMEAEEVNEEEGERRASQSSDLTKAESAAVRRKSSVEFASEMVRSLTRSSIAEVMSEMAAADVVGSIEQAATQELTAALSSAWAHVEGDSLSESIGSSGGDDNSMSANKKQAPTDLSVANKKVQVTARGAEPVTTEDNSTRRKPTNERNSNGDVDTAEAAPLPPLAVLELGETEDIVEDLADHSKLATPRTSQVYRASNETVVVRLSSPPKAAVETPNLVASKKHAGRTKGARANDMGDDLSDSANAGEVPVSPVTPTSTKGAAALSIDGNSIKEASGDKPEDKGERVGGDTT
jgi:hypothetical protein